MLSLDTATDQAGIALYNGVSVAELSWPAGRRQTVAMLPAVEWLLGACALTLDDVVAVGVAIGPGTFTGLRVGLSIAKGLAVASDRAVIGVSTIAIAAEPYSHADVPVIVTLAAGRGRVVWAEKPVGQEPGPPANASIDELIAVLRDRPECLVAGELPSDLRERVRRAHGRLAPVAASSRRPAALAGIAWRRWRKGERDDPSALEPVYLHGRSGGR